MPPYRRRYVKKRYSRSKSRSRGRSMGGSFMKRARTRAFANLRTGGLLAIERKFSDFARSAYVVGTGVGGAVVSGGASTFAPPRSEPDQYRTATGNILTVATVALNVLGIGDTGSDRDGRQVINDSIHLRGVASFRDATDYGTFNCGVAVNIVLVLDTQTNGGAPTGDLIFVNPGDISANSPARNGQSPFVNLSNSKRFRILKHIRRIITPSAISGNGTVTRASGGWAWSMDVPLKQMKTNYVSDLTFATGTQPTNASIGDNGLFLYAWTSIVNGVELSWNSRLRFRG